MSENPPVFYVVVWLLPITLGKEKGEDRGNAILGLVLDGRYNILWYGRYHRPIAYPIANSQYY